MFQIPRHALIPIHAALGIGAELAVKAIAGVDVVIAVDVDTDRMEVAYGIDTFERRAKDPTFLFSGLWFHLDFNAAEEVKGLLDLVVKAKGRHEWGQPLGQAAAALAAK